MYCSSILKNIYIFYSLSKFLSPPSHCFNSLLSLPSLFLHLLSPLFRLKHHSPSTLITVAHFFWWVAIRQFCGCFFFFFGVGHYGGCGFFFFLLWPVLKGVMDRGWVQCLGRGWVFGFETVDLLIISSSDGGSGNDFFWMGLLRWVSNRLGFKSTAWICWSVAWVVGVVAVVGSNRFDGFCVCVLCLIVCFQWFSHLGMWGFSLVFDKFWYLAI